MDEHAGCVDGFAQIPVADLPIDDKVDIAIQKLAQGPGKTEILLDKAESAVGIESHQKVGLAALGIEIPAPGCRTEHLQTHRAEASAKRGDLGAFSGYGDIRPFGSSTPYSVMHLALPPRQHSESESRLDACARSGSAVAD